MAGSSKSKKKQEAILFGLMGLIIVGLIISGIILFQKQFSGILEKAKNSDENPVAMTSNIASQTSSPAKSSPEDFIPSEDVQILQVYFGVKGQDKIESEAKRVHKSKVLITQVRQAVNSVLESPTSERLYKLLPEGVNLRGLFYESGVFIVDLSREFSEIYTFGTTEQVLAVYSIVNSICELDPKAKVRFLINGSEPDGEDGHIDLSGIFTKLDNIIAEK